MQLNSEMESMTDSGAITGMDAREDGVYITYIPSTGADAVTKKLGELGIKSYWMGVPGDYHITLYFDVSNFNKMTITAQRASNATRVCSVYYVKDAKFVNTGTSTGQIVDGGSLDISSYTTIGLAVGGSGTTTVNEYNFLFE